MTTYDFTIIGAGIVGLATALRLRERFPRSRIAIIEKEPRVAAHQSGHNSGVIHAGVYYEPGSLKARLCRAGLHQTVAFCTEHAIPFRQCGKLIVATTDHERERLQSIYKRARENGVACESLERPALAEIEPNVAGLAALRVVETGIVDYARICEKIAQLLIERDVEFVFEAEVTHIHEQSDRVTIETGRRHLTCRKLIACAGLQSDRIAALAGVDIDFAIVPFRGDFYRLRCHSSNIARHLIYPVPDPELPFLGIHLTATIDGGMMIGPSAMLALHREAYSKFAMRVPDVRSLAVYPGTWRLLARFPRAGLTELWHALSRRAYLRAAQKFCPALTLADLGEPYCGVRAQAVTSQGHLVHDFLVRNTSRTTHICNAPSPAATAALPIADEIINSYMN
jgi:L-2-hydroxyglutarate oxidase